MNKGIRIALVTALFCALGLVCYAIAKMNEERRHQVTCAGVKVEFADDFNFVTAEDIEGYLKKEYGAYIGQRLDSLTSTMLRSATRWLSESAVRWWRRRAISSCPRSCLRTW